MKEAVSGVAVLTEDEQIRQQCQAREDFEYWERMRENKHKRELEELEQKLAKKDRELTKQNHQHQRELTEKDDMLNTKNQEIAELNARIAELESRNSDLLH